MIGVNKAMSHNSVNNFKDNQLLIDTQKTKNKQNLTNLFQSVNLTTADISSKKVKNAIKNAQLMRLFISFS